MFRIALPILAALAVGAPALAEDGGRKLDTRLTGAAEVPGPGDPDGRGTASFTVNAGQRQVCYAVTYSAIERPTAAHIHRGGATVAGPVVVPLTVAANGAIEGCATVTRELAFELIKAPADFYANVHNTPFPGGAIRGQLGK